MVAISDNGRMPSSRLEAIVHRLEVPVALLALLVIPALVIEERATSPELQRVAVAVNWLICIVFVVEFGMRWAADRTVAFPRKAWSDVLLILIAPPFAVPESFQAARTLRALRLLRLARVFGVSAIAIRLAHRHFGADAGFTTPSWSLSRRCCSAPPGSWPWRRGRILRSAVLEMRSGGRWSRLPR